MHISVLLDMAEGALGDRVVLGSRSDGLTVAELAVRARRAASLISGWSGGSVVLLGTNSSAVPIALFGSALAGRPYAPVNYRLPDDRLRSTLARTAPSTVIVSPEMRHRVEGIDRVELVDRDDFLAQVADPTVPEIGDPVDDDPDQPAVLLFTSGTSGDPKVAVLRHSNLSSYVIGTVEFAGAEEDEAAIVSVPPYHIAAVSACLTALYGGRRSVYLEAFEARDWVALVRAESITHAMVVPTMLSLVLDVIDGDGDGLPSLRALSYGGGPMPAPVIERAMTTLDGVAFVNAYGLTETSSTISLLGPDDHREALASSAPAVRARLGSVGVPLPSVEVTIRDENDSEVPAGVVGEICVRGEQVSGEYLGVGRSDGWFRTRDSGHVDEGGYLFVHGRLDDVIVRGGENLSPGEIEAVLLEHPGVAQVAVVGVPDERWGEAVAAVVVPVGGDPLDPEALSEHVRARLRSTCAPAHVVFRDELPFNETGKLLRRVLRAELTEALGLVAGGGAAP